MGSLFLIFGYISSYIVILLFALCVLAGLYVCAGLAEEFPSLTKKCIKYTIVLVLVLHIILCLDGLPYLNILIGLISHLVYSTLLFGFPFTDIISIKTFLSLIAFITSHYFWFSYFLYQHEADHIDMFHIIGFFTIMVWIIPFGFFISVSINDNILPGIRPPEHTNGLHKHSNHNIFRTIFDSISVLGRNLIGLTTSPKNNKKK